MKIDRNSDAYFSASYSNCKHNFVIKNIPQSRNKPDLIADAFTCVVKNILQRSPVVRPSRYLLQKLGCIPTCDRPYYLLDRQGSLQNWSKTIKGAPNGYNPAKYFFYNIWDSELHEYNWVRQFVLPEAEINNILQDPDESFINQAVDFYLPQAKLVIEIDGITYHDKAYDMKRDKALNANGIKVVRIPVSALENSTAEFRAKISEIRSRIADSKEINQIAEQPEYSKELDIRMGYDEVMRFQLALLTLLERNVISLNSEKWLFSVAENKQHLFTIAANDLFLWFKNLYILKNRDYNYPVFQYSNDKEAIKIHSHMFRRYDDATESDYISILTDYYDEKDYFCVSCSEAINYNIAWPLSDERNKALEFFLLNIFGYESFRPGQLQIITNILNLKKTVGVLPTGSGKSICYFLASILQPCASFAVCPITSLLIDQKRNLDEFGVTRSAYISSVQERDEKHKTITDFGKGKYLMTWVAPERFQSEDFRRQIELVNHNLNLAYAVIDEVHCLSEWGHDFRTSYLTLIRTIDSLCPQITLVGLTATASQAVLVDLKAEFGIDSAGVKALTSLSRENLAMRVIKCSGSSEAALYELLAKRSLINSDNIGIIFTHIKSNSFRNNGCINLRDQLKKKFGNEQNLTIGTFHADLSNSEKLEVQSQFIQNKINILTATKAFGMGINKEDVRYTIHYGLPWSIESYYQEAGRAGRDGNPAECYIIYSPETNIEANVVNELFLPKTPPKRVSEIVQSKLINKDLSTIFFLWQLNNKGVDSDLNDIKSILRILYGKEISVEITSTPNLSQAQIQKALYRLKLLGIVKDWIIKEWGRDDKKLFKEGKLDVILSEGSWNEKAIRKNILAYIRKYDPNFGKTGTEDRNEKYYNILKSVEEPVVVRYAAALIEWTYDHIIYTRRRMIYNIMHLCDTYSNEHVFRSQIDNYLRITERTVVLDSIVARPDEWHLWLDAFYDISNYEGDVSRHVLKIDGFKELHMTAARYLESYKDITGLNLVYIISGLISNDFDGDVDLEMFNNCMYEIGKYNLQIQADLVNGILTVVGRCSDRPSEAMLQVLSESVIKWFPNMAIEVYENLKDDYSLFICLKKATKEIKKILEGQKWLMLTN